MQNSVLTLGEKIVLATRLAAIEHVRQELEAAHAASRRPAGFMDESDAVTLSRPVGLILKDVFQRIEAADPTVKATKPALTAGRINGGKRRRGAA